MKARSRQFYKMPIAVLLLSGFLASCSLITNAGNSVPGAPSGVSVSAQTITNIQVSWAAVSGAQSYTIYYTNDGTTPSSSNYTQTWGNVSASPTVVAVNFQSPSPVQFAVTATNTNGEGNASAPVTVQNPIVSSGVSASVNLSPGPGLSTTTMAVTWASVPGAATYNVYRSDAVSSSPPAPTSTATSPATGIAGLSVTWNSSLINYYYEFSVAAVDSAGNVGALSAASAAVLQ